MVNPDRLSALDTTFLDLESERGPMHVGALARFEGGPLRDRRGALDRARIVRHVEARIANAPRFHQRLAWVPFGAGRPVWTDDPHFNIHYHVRFTGLPRPGGAAELEGLTAELMARRLDRERPLWEMHWVDGLDDGRVGLVLKVHHCMVDGVAGMNVAAVIFDLDPAAVVEAAPAFRPRPEPSGFARWRDALAERAVEPARFARAASARLASPRALVKTLVDEAAGLRAWLGEGFAPRTCLNVPIGPHRRFATATFPLASAKGVKNVLGGTVNDVVLATVAGALRRFLLHRGATCLGLELHVAVPVNVRPGADGRGLGNRVAAMMVRLPVEIADPARRYERIRLATRVRKHSHEIELAEVITELPGFPPATLLHHLGDLQPAQRFLNTVVTNVPGPPFPLYACGARLLDLHPCIPLGPNLPLMVGVVSYEGKLGVGLMGDWDAMADLEVLARHFEEAFGELVAAASPRSKRSTEAAPRNAAARHRRAGREARRPSVHIR
ncbi:MAG: wax ester/triacylglycerol synthase family O-acyltransferase [Deltaproteobacteria bacterium]|nr:wax ester/triacylglycerol synthase family O-acyltransferase [Deltaproteobacteria bacterium]